VNDRELLELAAKGARLYVCTDLEYLGLKVWGDELWVKEDKYANYRQWNPLLSSEDAFQLMVKLRILVEYVEEMDSVTCSLPGSMGATSVAAIGDVELRYAIVKAAAQLGATL